MQSANPKRLFVYRIDENDRIVSVNSDWVSFARENQAETLTSEAVVGQPLLRFVTDKETRHLYQVILEKVRETLRTMVIPFRCDGPEVRRFMELEISPKPEAKVRFEGRILREEHRKSVPLFETSIVCSDELVNVCSWCKRVDVSGDWLEVEVAITRMKLFHTTHLPQITHGICPECNAQIKLELESF
jgi:hypothetical protein